MSASRAVAGYLHSRPALAAAIVALLAVLVYANTFRAGFVWDDASSILLHQHVKDPSKVLHFFAEDQHAFAGGQGNFYRPLLSITFMIDYVIARLGQPPIAPAEIPEDLNPVVFHLMSALWHAVATAVLLVYLRLLGAPLAVYLTTAAIFAVHPLHTEAVAYISGRADSMAAAFVFAALCFSAWNAPGRSPRLATVLMLACFTAALLSKEAAFIFPALLVLSRIARPAKVDVRGIRAWIPELMSFVLLGVYIILRVTFLNFGSDTQPRGATWTTRTTETFQALALYVNLFFVPTGLHMERSLGGVSSWVAAAGAVLLAVILAAAFVAYRTGHRRSAFGFSWFLVTWLPISGIIPLNAPMAEHWMYVPLAGFFLGLCGVAHALLKNARPLVHRAAITALVLWLAALSFLTVQRNRDWRDDESLYVATLRENPDSTRVHFNLAVVYQDILNNPTGARRHFDAVTRAYHKRKAERPSDQGKFWPEELEAHLSLGDLYAAEHRYVEAFGHYRVLLGIAPAEPNKPLIAHAALGAARCFLATGDVASARVYLNQAQTLAPQLASEVQRMLPE